MADISARGVQARLGVVAEDEAQALVSRVFNAYIDLMRKVQTTYWCPPPFWAAVISI